MIPETNPVKQFVGDKNLPSSLVVKRRFATEYACDGLGNQAGAW